MTAALLLVSVLALGVDVESDDPEFGSRVEAVATQLVDVRKIAQIHEAGLQAGAWTVNDETTMVRLLNMGIDRIYTDDPACLPTLDHSNR
jgi:glycerophosphoryl diester phosphodiesterase